MSLGTGPLSDWLILVKFARDKKIFLPSIFRNDDVFKRIILSDETALLFCDNFLAESVFRLQVKLFKPHSISHRYLLKACY